MKNRLNRSWVGRVISLPVVVRFVVRLVPFSVVMLFLVQIVIVRLCFLPVVIQTRLLTLSLRFIRGVTCRFLSFMKQWNRFKESVSLFMKLFQPSAKLSVIGFQNIRVVISMRPGMRRRRVGREKTRGRGQPRRRIRVLNRLRVLTELPFRVNSPKRGLVTLIFVKILLVPRKRWP